MLLGNLDLILFFFFNILLIYFRERGKEGGSEEEKYQCVVPLAHPQAGTQPAIQACALTGTQSGDLWVHRLRLNPLSYTSQG